MINDLNPAKKVAKYLLQIKAIILQPNNPFNWASGWKSPIYCDNRKTLSHPEIRTYIKKSLSQLIKKNYKNTQVIAGVATAGIPHGALVAEELGLPFIYIRSEAKKHGKKNQIEGAFKKGETAILIEDLISSGKSSLTAARALQEAGMNVKGVVSIFTYGFNTASKNFKNTGYKYISLCDYNTLLAEAIQQNYIKQEDLPILKKWREDPETWKQ